jgi:hypothetical protein
MKVEHTLAPEMQAYIKQANEALNQNRREYLQTLGMVKETEIRRQMLEAAISEQLAIVQQAAKLPPSTTGYRVSEDGTKLIGETAESPAAMPGPVIEPEVLAAAPRMVNGV